MLQLPPASGVRAGGNLTQTGNSISGILHVAGSPCFDPATDDLIVSGIATPNSISFSTAPVRGQTLSFTSAATPPLFPVPNRFISGPFTLSGGTCAQQGLLSAAAIAPLSGNWAGSVGGTFNANVNVSLTQTGPDAHGFFHLAGTFTFAGSSCFTSGAIVTGTLSGGLANLQLNTSDGGQTTVTMTVVDATNPISMDSTFTIQSGTCSGTSGTATLNKL